MKMNQGAAKKVLLQAGVLPVPSNVKTLSFACWCCQTKNAMTYKTGFRCQEKGCSARCRVTNAEVAFTPLFHTAAGGCDPDYRELLRVSYLIGSKVSNDQAVHFLRTSEQSLDAATHRVKLLYPRLRLCLAWTEKVVADKTQYERELVEIDSSRMCGKKRKGPSAASSSSTSLGRTLVVVGRFARKWAVRGLADRQTKRACGPETREEVSGTVKQALGRRTILCGDGARAWEGAARSAGKAHLPGVAHNKRIFTPVARVKKSSLNRSTQSWLKAKSRGSCKANPLQETQRDFKFVAGANLAECAFSAVKRTARRMNVVGAGAKN